MKREKVVGINVSGNMTAKQANQIVELVKKMAKKFDKDSYVEVRKDK